MLTFILALAITIGILSARIKEGHSETNNLCPTKLFTFFVALALAVGILSAINALLAPLAEIIADDVVTLITKQENTPQ